MRRLDNLRLVALAVAVGLACGGCGRARRLALGAGAPVQPPRGFLFTQQKAPLAFTGEVPDVVPPTPREAAPRVAGLTPATKCGKAEASNVIVYYRLLSVGWGDCSVETAARNAGITRIAFADYELFSVLGLYNRMTVYVYGE